MGIQNILIQLPPTHLRSSNEAKRWDLENSQHCPINASHERFAPAKTNDGCWSRVNSLGDLQAGLNAVPSDMSNDRVSQHVWQE